MHTLGQGVLPHPRRAGQARVPNGLVAVLDMAEADCCDVKGPWASSDHQG